MFEDEALDPSLAEDPAAGAPAGALGMLAAEPPPQQQGPQQGGLESLRTAAYGGMSPEPDQDAKWLAYAGAALKPASGGFGESMGNALTALAKGQHEEDQLRGLYSYRIEQQKAAQARAQAAAAAQQQKLQVSYTNAAISSLAPLARSDKPVSMQTVGMALGQAVTMGRLPAEVAQRMYKSLAVFGRGNEGDMRKPLMDLWQSTVSPNTQMISDRIDRNQAAGRDLRRELAADNADLRRDLAGQASADRAEARASREAQAAETRAWREEEARKNREFQEEMTRLRNSLKNDPKDRPMPAHALKLQQEEVEAIDLAANIDKDLSAYVKQIDRGELKPNLVDNTLAGVRTFFNASKPEDRNFNAFKATLEKLRNDSLRLNKGVQTEGDSQRAWNELLTNLNDKENVKTQLNRIVEINRRAVKLRKVNVDRIRQEYGRDPIDLTANLEQNSVPRTDGSPQNTGLPSQEAIAAELARRAKLKPQPGAPR